MSHPKFSNVEIQRMLCAVGDEASCRTLNADREAIRRSRWVCATSSISTVNRYCDMTVPIKRFIALPDALGAVLFERDEFDNAAYAVEAAHPGQLCAADTQPPSARAFASDVLVEP